MKRSTAASEKTYFNDKKSKKKKNDHPVPIATLIFVPISDTRL